MINKNNTMWDHLVQKQFKQETTMSMGNSNQSTCLYKTTET